MCRRLSSGSPVILLLMMVGLTLMAADEDRVLFDFGNPETAEQWQAVNDGVMGGLSDGQFKISNEKTMDFFGTLSLENNGGFASVRSRPKKLGLEQGDTLVARVRGDGREYTMNLYVPRPRVAFSYRSSFKTKKGEWVEILAPLDKFVATSFGRVVPNEPLNPGEVNAIGLLLSDKKAGPFKLEVEWIKVQSGFPVAAAMLVQRDIAYVDAGHERHKLDVYTPTDGENHPVVFWIHGGGWQAGDKSSVQVKPQAFVNRGFVFASTNYRLLPDATIKQMGEDVAKAMRWVHNHAEEYGGDPSRMFVMGHSAGAQLAALVCTDDRFIKAEGFSPSIIKGCVPVDGDTYDVPMQIATVEQRRADRYRMKFGDEESQKDFSPVTHVAKGKYIPPVLILHVAEHPETKMQSQRLAKALQEAGFSAKAYPAQNKDHTSINADLGLPGDEPTKALFEFVDRALTLGFDASKVRPPDAEKGEPVARLFYDYIYPADIGVASPKLTDDEARRLTDRIFGDLRRRCMDRHKITATPEEIQQFVAAMNRLSPADDDVSEERKKEDQRGLEAIGEQMVKGWKLDRMLYKKYGGTVIFQQGNPFEPVGAYRKFLEETEEAKVFEVYDPDNRTEKRAAGS